MRTHTSEIFYAVSHTYGEKSSENPFNLATSNVGK